MAKKASNETLFEEHIIGGAFGELIGERFGRYSKYVIQERALPDARDGLKPVQRRILFAMDQLGLHSDKQYKKSARIVGEVIGKYHPHGDTSVYDAMVRLSQTWKLRIPLIDMHGNNGSIDGDGAAAMRYTETRLSKESAILLKDIDKKTIDFAPNFDDSEWEPVVLPSGFPNLIANGSTGIAAGYATNIPPHNLGEIIKATIHRIKHPDCKPMDIIKMIKGPDFPTGGIVEGKEDIIKALSTGRGRVLVRSKITFEKNENKTDSIIITEIPYEVNKANLVRKIDQARFDEKIPGIDEVRDETDRTGLRIAIDLEKNANKDVIKNALLKMTDLQTYYSYNMVAIVKGTPKTLSVVQLIDEYIRHRVEIITRRTQFLLNKCEKRLNIVEGLILAVNHLDNVIKLIRKSTNKSEAKNRLMDKYKLSDEQAEAIVTLRLYRLSSTDIDTLLNEKKTLHDSIKEYKTILKKEKVLMDIIVDELKEINEKHETPRRTKVQDEVTDIVVDEKDLIKNEDCIIVVTRDGYVKRISKKKLDLDSLDEKDYDKKNSDIILSIIDTNTLEQMLLILSNGKYVVIDVHNIKQANWNKPGTHINDYVKIGSGNVKVISCMQVQSFANSTKITIASKDGLIKRLDFRELKTSRINKALTIMKCKKGDEIVSAIPNIADRPYILVVTKNGMAAKYLQATVSVIGPNAAGVKAMNLKPGDEVAGIALVTDDDMVAILTKSGQGKRFDSNLVPLTGRATVGRLVAKKMKTKSEEIICVYRIKPRQHIFINMGDVTKQVFGKDIPIFSLEQSYSTIMKKTFFDTATRNSYLIKPDGSKEYEADPDEETIHEIIVEEKKKEIKVLEKERDYADADADIEKTTIINTTIEQLLDDIELDE